MALPCKCDKLQAQPLGNQENFAITKAITFVTLATIKLSHKKN